MAERQVLQGLRRYDLSDVFRAKHSYGREEFSYYTNNRGKRIGRRFDHIFASHLLEVVECEYLQELRVQKLSDHAPIEALFTPKAPIRI
jgi:exonuclease III